MGNSDYSVRLRTADGEWQSLFSYNVKVDMHEVRNASMVMFDCSGEVEMEVQYHLGRVRNAIVRPLSYGIKCEIKEQVITFKIDQPRLLSLEVNGGRFNNLHIFANPLSDDPVPVEPEGEETMVLKPGMHRVRELSNSLEHMSRPRIIFGPGILENLHFADIDILEHHEPQPDYWGCVAINAGDNNTVRNVTYEHIRIEDFELGELFNLRVLINEKYNPAPGKRIENIHFKNIHYNGTCNNPSHIEGYDESRTVSDITFENVTVNGEKFALNHDYVVLGNHVHGVKLINH